MIILFSFMFSFFRKTRENTDIRRVEIETDDACAVRCCDDPDPGRPRLSQWHACLSWPGQRVSVVQLGASVTCISFQHTESVNSELSLSPGKHFLKVNIECCFVLEVPNRVRTKQKGEKRSTFTLSCWARHSKSSAWQLFTVIAAQTLLDLCRVTFLITVQNDTNIKDRLWMRSKLLTRPTVSDLETSESL